MVEYNHNVISFNSDTAIKGGHGVVVAVFCSKKGSSGIMASRSGFKFN